MIMLCLTTSEIMLCFNINLMLCLNTSIGEEFHCGKSIIINIKIGQMRVEKGRGDN